MFIIGRYPDPSIIGQPGFEYIDPSDDQRGIDVFSVIGKEKVELVSRMICPGVDGIQSVSYDYYFFFVLKIFICCIFYDS